MRLSKILPNFKKNIRTLNISIHRTLVGSYKQVVPADNHDTKQRVYFLKTLRMPAISFKHKEDKCADSYLMKGELLLSKYGWPSHNHAFVKEDTLEQVYIHLLLSNYLDAPSLNNLNNCHKLFSHLTKMLKHIKLDYICKLFDHDRRHTT